MEQPRDAEHPDRRRERGQRLEVRRGSKNAEVRLESTSIQALEQLEKLSLRASDSVHSIQQVQEFDHGATSRSKMPSAVRRSKARVSPSHDSEVRCQVDLIQRERRTLCQGGAADWHFFWRSSATDVVACAHPGGRAAWPVPSATAPPSDPMGARADFSSRVVFARRLRPRRGVQRLVPRVVVRQVLLVSIHPRRLAVCGSDAPLQSHHVRRGTRRVDAAVDRPAQRRDHPPMRCGLAANSWDTDSNTPSRSSTRVRAIVRIVKAICSC